MERSKHSPHPCGLQAHHISVATCGRLDDPLFTHTLFGVYLGVLAWGGLWLRDPVLRAVFPLRQA
jgi:hypothetical protein